MDANMEYFYSTEYMMTKHKIKKKDRNVHTR